MPLYFLLCVNFKKAFNRVPREVLWWALREWNVGQFIPPEAYIKMRELECQASEEFEVKFGAHQGTVLSSLLLYWNLCLLISTQKSLGAFICWWPGLSDWDPWGVLLRDLLTEWLTGLQERGLIMNMAKTKVMVSGVGLDFLKDSGKFPCAVCCKGVGVSSL